MCTFECKGRKGLREAMVKLARPYPSKKSVLDKRHAPEKGGRREEGGRKAWRQQMWAECSSHREMSGQGTGSPTDEDYISPDAACSCCRLLWTAMTGARWMSLSASWVGGAQMLARPDLQTVFKRPQSRTVFKRCGQIFPRGGVLCEKPLQKIGFGALFPPGKNRVPISRVGSWVGFPRFWPGLFLGSHLPPGKTRVPFPG